MYGWHNSNAIKKVNDKNKISEFKTENMFKNDDDDGRDGNDVMWKENV